MGKGGYGTAKQCIAVAVEREGAVKAALVPHNGESALGPFVKGTVDPAAYLMSDHNEAYVKIAECFAGHSYVDHGDREYARGEVHNNTAESYNAMLERAKIGVFHQMSKEHMHVTSMRLPSGGISESRLERESTKERRRW